MRRVAFPALLGGAHGVADAAAGLLLGGLLHKLALPTAGAFVLLYNALAFGGQPVAGMLVDRDWRPKSAAVSGLLLLGAALIAAEVNPTAAVLLAGVGSAFFHVGAGAMAIRATRGRALGPGLFAAPGVIGLATGGALAWTGRSEIWPLVLLLLASAITVAIVRPTTTDTDELKDESISGDCGILLLVLLGAIALRSAVWSSFQFALQGRVGTLLLIALGACAGKMLGGVLADLIGWRRWTVGALLVATPLLVFGEQHIVLLLAGVALLQSSTPVALAAASRLLPGKPATAAGLALGLAIAAGGAPVFGGLMTKLVGPALVSLIIASSALTLWWVLAPANGIVRRRAEAFNESR